MNTRIVLDNLSVHENANRKLHTIQTIHLQVETGRYVKTEEVTH
jgi:hypothetical protein